MQRDIDRYILNELEWYGSGNDLYQDQIAYGCIQVSQAIQWLHTEVCGLSFIKHLTKEFGEVEVLEHVSDFYKLKVPRGDTTIGYTFGKIESCKPNYHIAEYSVSQTTLEQIFQAFAKVKIGENTDKSIFSLDQHDDIVLNNQVSQAGVFYENTDIPENKFFNQYCSDDILGTGGDRKQSSFSPRRSKQHLKDQEELKQGEKPPRVKKNLRFESTDWNEEEMLEQAVKDKLGQKLGNMYKKEDRKIKRNATKATNSQQNSSGQPQKPSSRGSGSGSTLQNAGAQVVSGGKVSPK